MRRNVSLSEISDGRLYTENDMVKADCRGCVGCSDCCRGMGESIILDPYDAFRLSVGLGRPFADFLEKEVELHVVDGVILPNLRMRGEGEACAFLDGQGRCGIHPYRPGICRIFPLGRYYENGGFRYFLQSGECRAARSKVKVSKWIDTRDQKQNREFVIEWHYLLNRTEKYLESMAAGQPENAETTGTTQMDDLAKKINMALLQIFYFTPYDEEIDFYTQFRKNSEHFERLLLQK